MDDPVSIQAKEFHDRGEPKKGIPVLESVRNEILNL